MAELSIAGSAGIPLMIIATTNGEAAAVVPPFLLPSSNFWSCQGRAFLEEIPKQRRGEQYGRRSA